jgi:uracil-DNA glycosylase family 4
VGREAAERREDLVALYREASDCVKCPLAQGRTQVVFGAGNADADLMFVGEAPGFHEDQQGIPFVGRAGKLLDELLAEQGIERSDVFIANVLKCLRYNVPVQLGDGSWERVGRLVRDRYTGTVMSVDEDGSIVPRQVTGWHASPLGSRRVYRLTYRSAKHVGSHRVNSQLTGDHQVLTRRGFVAAQDLLEGDEVATGQGLSETTHDIICGTLLGDGSISARSAHLVMGHSERQRDYVTFLEAVLHELEPRVVEYEAAAVAGGSRSYGVVNLRTRAHRSLGILRSAFYAGPGGRKSVPTWLATGLTPLMVAVWFMDDGHMRIRPGRQPLAEIAAHAFDQADHQILLRGLARLGVPAASRKGRLHFNAASTHLLSRLIAPYVPSAMRYKLHPEAETAIPLDPSLFGLGRPKVLFDQVEVEDITAQRRSDTTFFCIDVEETHNFVTAGGVVHNCRPPENRDPQPEEIETCRPYLERQVQLIEPKVICTLGNFSTKLLTGSPQGITRVHGHPQERELGGRTVKLFPIFHPAAALRTPRVKEELREDFAKLPALLAEPVAQPEPPPAPPLQEEAVVAPAADQLGLFG